MYPHRDSMYLTDVLEPEVEVVFLFLAGGFGVSIARKLIVTGADEATTILDFVGTSCALFFHCLGGPLQQ